ncbi:MAG TPA: hypothetical protein VFZ35_04330 [Sphingomicrobium sp.]
MKMLLATAAALSVAAIFAEPAQAESRSSHGVRIHSGTSFVQHRDGFGGFDRRDRRRHDRDSEILVGGWVGGEWALYNNRSFEPDSYNDWWHERPWRSYPRWMASGNCDRLWWGGGAWRCGW